MAKDRFKKFKIQKHLFKYNQAQMPHDLEAFVKFNEEYRQLAVEAGMLDHHIECHTPQPKRRGKSGKVKVFSPEEIAEYALCNDGK